MQTLTIKSPVAQLQIPPKVWLSCLAILILGLTFLFWRWRRKRGKLEKGSVQDEPLSVVDNTSAEMKGDAEEVEDSSEISIKPIIESNPFDLPTGLRLPALSFHPTWEIIPLLPQQNTPLAYRIFNSMGIAGVEVELKTTADKVAWFVRAEGLKSIRVPLEDAVQLRAVIASYLQQVSPMIYEEE